jgi:transcriptional regulator with XRE-family HTH domain
MSRGATAPKPARTRAVTASRFRDTRAVCCLTVPEAAKLLRVTPRTVQNWESGRVRLPYSAFKLMRILRGYELPGAAWRGYRLKGDTLWSPEGLAFKASDHYWWSLTCRMAAEFRTIMRERAALASSGLLDVPSVLSAFARAEAFPPPPAPPARGALDGPESSSGAGYPPPRGVPLGRKRPSRPSSPLPKHLPSAGANPCAPDFFATPSSNHGVKSAWNKSSASKHVPRPSLRSRASRPVASGGEA